MRYWVIFILLCFHTAALSQKHDYVWRFTNHAKGSTPNFSTTYILNFNQDSIYFDSTWMNVTLDSGASFYADSSGNLLFQTSGCYISDTNGDTIPNSVGLSIGSHQYTTFCDVLGGYLIWQFGFFLQWPGVPGKYFLIYPEGNYVITGLNYATLQKTATGYEVSEKNIPLVRDSILIGGYQATKHANGRDWWIVAMKEKSNRIYKWLLDPEGIHDYGYQEVGVKLVKTGINKTVFSPDGSLLAYSNHADDLRLWDFDRCSGVLTNPRHYPHQDTADLPIGIISGGMSISQDGAKLYRGNAFQLYQYDLEAQDIGASRTLIFKYDSTSFTKWNSDVLGGSMELGPDGRIYINTAHGTSFRMHRINHPERSAFESGFEYKKYYFDRGYAAMPMFPNYRLGPLDGSACDTLGLNNYPLAGFRYDRLAGLLVDFTSVSWYKPETWLWNFGDPTTGASNTSTEMHPDHVFSAPGYYTVCLTVSNSYGSDSICKLVYIDASVDAQEPQLTKTEQGVLVYPNPASEWAELLFPRPVRGALRLISATSGATVLESAITSERIRLDVHAVPAGVYAWSVLEDDGRAWTGRLVVVR
jgi:PKD repeat protein